MTGYVYDSIVSVFEASFRHNCMTLIGEAYEWLKNSKNITIDWKEENITANIATHIDNSPQAMEWDIHAEDEHHIYNQKILSGKVSAKSAPRVDIRMSICCPEMKRRFDYYIEAKNLIENNCVSPGKGRHLSAKALQKRYVSTGIDNLVSGHYPSNGCLIGYVLEGTVPEIVKGINGILTSYGRADETLKISDSDIPQFFDTTYASEHNGGYSLFHYFMAFV